MDSIDISEKISKYQIKMKINFTEPIDSENEKIQI